MPGDGSNKPPITLRELTAENWQECIRLEVSGSQSDWVDTNLYSIAESRFWPGYNPLAIYADEEMVGFVMYGYEDGDEGREWWIANLMIDRAHQGRGHGRTAVREVIRRLREESDCQEIRLGYDVENEAARRLYAGLGFVEQGLDEEGDMVAVLKL